MHQLEAGQSAIDNIRIPKKKKNTKQPDPYNVCLTVPTVIQITPVQFDSIHPGRQRRWVFDKLFECIPSSTREELKRISGRPIDHDCPGTASSYKKKITAFIEAASGNRKLKAWASEITENPTKDYYVIYLDKQGHRIIVSIYYGSKYEAPAPPPPISDA